MPPCTLSRPACSPKIAPTTPTWRETSPPSKEPRQPGDWPVKQSWWETHGGKRGREKKNNNNCLEDVRKCGTQDESKLIHIFFFFVPFFPGLISIQTYFPGHSPSCLGSLKNGLEGGWDWWRFVLTHLCEGSSPHAVLTCNNACRQAATKIWHRPMQWNVLPVRSKNLYHASLNPNWCQVEVQQSVGIVSCNTRPYSPNHLFSKPDVQQQNMPR